MGTYPECDMGFNPEEPANVRFHTKYHDRVVNGIIAPQKKADQIIWEEEPFRVSVVNSLSPFPLRFRAEVVGSCAHTDNTCKSYDFGPFAAEGMPLEKDTHAFLLHKHNRVIGIVTAQKAKHVWKCTWEQYENHQFEELVGYPPMWGIAFAWIHRRYRGQGLTRRVIVEAAAFFTTNVEFLGWQTPFTQSAKKMIKRLCPTCFYIAK
jgi:hypothetical protein